MASARGLLCQRTLSACGGALVSQRSRTQVLARFTQRDHYAQPTVYTALDPVCGGVSPGCQSVLIALLEKEVTFREMKVDLANKPSEFKDLYHSVVPDRDVRERVPVLVNGADKLVESSVIVDYLDAMYKDNGTPLTPPDPYAAARVRIFTAYFMDHVIPAYNQLLKANEAGVGSAKEQLMRALASVDDFLALHGAGEGQNAVGPHYSWNMSQEPAASNGQAGAKHEHFLLGPFFTTAEVLCTPWVARMVEALPVWRSIDVLAECESRKLVRVAGWMRACLARPSAKKTSPSAGELVEGLCEWEWSHV